MGFSQLVNAKTILTVVFGLMWAGAAIVGGRAMLKYESTPGKVGSVSKWWPADSPIQPADDRPTLVMFAHPQCPCTRASVAELAQLVARIQSKARVYVLFYTPRAIGSQWDDTNLRREAAAIPGVKVLSDHDGVEARRLGAETSGHTFLFAADGRLLFNGGITASRGHSGDNVGESAIVSLIDNQSSERAQTLVFGCALSNRGEQQKAALCLR